jgi:hypothetical protein
VVDESALRSQRIIRGGLDDPCRRGFHADKYKARPNRRAQNFRQILQTSLQIRRNPDGRERRERREIPNRPAQRDYLVLCGKCF